MREEEEGLEELSPEEEERLIIGLAHAVASLQLTLAHCRCCSIIALLSISLTCFLQSEEEPRVA